MRVLPISLLEPTLARVRSLRQTVIRRAVGLLSRCRPGDRLWVREPFHLGAAFDHFAPTAAVEYGAEVIFAIDGVPADAGQRRHARALPRVCHRMHLLLTAVREERLQDIDEAGIADAGLATHVAFAADWDKVQAPDKRSITGVRIRWADNPRVVVLTFTPSFTPLPDAQFAVREKVAA